MQQRFFSGIQPSGDMTLGNYLGAIANHVTASKKAEGFYCVVDLHAITVRQEPQKLRSQTHSVAAWYLAAGLDTEKSPLFVQSHVRAHTELAWLLNTFTQMGELERMTQFKEKAERHRNNINAGLFTYPCLMAADILLYNTTHVPVGEDQKQHLELTRDIALRFNNAYNSKTFVVPEVVMPPVAARVMDLQDPARKMSKSVESGGTVFLHEDMAATVKKFKRAVTDNLANVAWNRDEQPGVTNLLGIYCALKNTTPDAVVAAFSGKGYGDLKTAVADAVVATLKPIQTRYKELLAHPDHLDALLAKGAARANELAEAKVAEVKTIMGFVPVRV